MVRPLDLAEDRAVLNLIDEVIAYEEVVDAPADIRGASAEQVAPPSVVALTAVKEAEGVDVAVGYELIQTLTLYRQEAGVVAILPGAREIDFLVGGVLIAGDDQPSPLTPQPVAIVQESIVEVELVSEPFETALAVGKVAVDKREGLELGNEHAALFVESFDAQPSNRLGFERDRAIVADPGGDAAIPFFPG